MYLFNNPFSDDDSRHVKKLVWQVSICITPRGVIYLYFVHGENIGDVTITCSTSEGTSLLCFSLNSRAGGFLWQFN